VHAAKEVAKNAPGHCLILGPRLDRAANMGASLRLARSLRNRSKCWGRNVRIICGEEPIQEYFRYSGHKAETR
jgi:hypothetical protein